MTSIARPRRSARMGNRKPLTVGLGLTPTEYMAKYGTPAQKRAAKQRTANRYPTTNSGLEIISIS